MLYLDCPFGQKPQRHSSPVRAMALCVTDTDGSVRDRHDTSYVLPGRQSLYSSLHHLRQTCEMRAEMSPPSAAYRSDRRADDQTPASCLRTNQANANSKAGQYHPDARHRRPEGIQCSSVAVLESLSLHGVWMYWNMVCWFPPLSTITYYSVYIKVKRIAAEDISSMRTINYNAQENM
nr:hypothetical protein Iba_chr10aCG8170 [Ipomoea batatas]